MPELMVQIDDTTVPLKDCCWVEYAPCGCPCGALTAAYGDEAHATEDQARREFCPTKKERDKAARQGFRLKLMTFDRYRAEIDLLARCATCAPTPKEVAS